MMMRHKPEDFYGYVSAKGITKLDKIAEDQRITISQLAKANRRIIADYSDRCDWYCLKVSERREFTVEKYLYEENVEALVPSFWTALQYARGRMMKPARVPVTPGYVMVQVAPDPVCFIALRRVKHVDGVLGGLERPFRIPFKTMNKFRERAEGGAFNERVVNTRFIVGQPVRVMDGPFASFDGTVIETSEKGHRLKVEVNIFGRSTPVELDVAQVDEV